MLRSYWLLALLAASAVLGTAGAAFAAQGGSVTYFPNGLSLSTIGDSATSTVDEDDLYVKGLVEIDGDVLLGDSSGDTITIAGTPTFSAAVGFSGSVTLGDASADTVTVNADTVSLTDGSVLKVETLQFVDSTGLIVKDGSLNRITITTNGNPDDSDVSLVVKDGANSGVQTVLLWDDGNNYSSFSAAVRFTSGASFAGDITASADNARAIGASGTEFATAWVQTVDDGDGTVSIGANLVPDADNTHALGASGTEFATAWVQAIDDNDGTVDVAAALTADSITLDANSDSVVSGSGAHKGSYLEAADGTTAITLTDSTALATFAGSITMATGKVLTAETIAAVDADGVTIKGFTGDADLLQVADASAERFAITTSAAAGAITLTFTDAADAGTIVYDHDATAEFLCNHGFEALELDSATIGAADGTNAITIADSTGAITVVGAATSFSNVACTVGLGTASSTSGSQLSIFDGGSDNKPGAIALYQDDGAATWLFARSDGTLAVHTAYPTDDDADGTAVGTFNMAADVDLTSADGTNADPDLSVAGYAEFNLGGLTLTATAAPPSATATPSGQLWMTNATPDGGKTAHKLYVFADTTWVAVH